MIPSTKEGEEWAAQFSVAVQTEVMKLCSVSVILCCTVPFSILQASLLVFPQTSHTFTSYILSCTFKLYCVTDSKHKNQTGK